MLCASPPESATRGSARAPLLASSFPRHLNGTPSAKDTTGWRRADDAAQDYSSEPVAPMRPKASPHHLHHRWSATSGYSAMCSAHRRRSLVSAGARCAHAHSSGEPAPRHIMHASHASNNYDASIPLPADSSLIDSCSRHPPTTVSSTRARPRPASSTAGRCSRSTPDLSA